MFEDPTEMHCSKSLAYCGYKRDVWVRANDAAIYLWEGLHAYRYCTLPKLLLLQGKLKNRESCALDRIVSGDRSGVAVRWLVYGNVIVERAHYALALHAGACAILPADGGRRASPTQVPNKITY